MKNKKLKEKDKEKNKEKENRGSKGTKKNEILGIVLLSLTLLVFLSLISYIPATKDKNLGGLIGYYLAYAIILVLGEWGAYIIPLLTLVWGWQKVRNLEKERPPVKIIGLLLALVCSCLLFALVVDLEKAGGLVGNFLGNLLLKALARPGAHIVVWTGLVTSFLLVTEISLVRVFERIKERLAIMRARMAEEKKEPAIEIQTPPPPVVLPLQPPKIEPEGKRPGLFGSEPGTKPGQEEKQETGEEKKDKERRPEFKPENFQRPALELLAKQAEVEEKIRTEDLQNNAQLLVQTLNNFGVSATVIKINPGPVVTRYDLLPAPGVRISKITGLTDDLALAMHTTAVRVQTAIPEAGAVGLEIPNTQRAVVGLREILQSEQFQGGSSKLTLALGKTTSGVPYVADLLPMPHLLIAGATGSGKSVCIHSLIMSIFFKARPDQVKLLLIDPKRLELPVYDDIAYLYHPVIVDAKEAAQALTALTGEMDRRHKQFAKFRANNLVTYNEVAKKEGQKEEPYLVVIIDELADLMLMAPRQVEEAITRLSQMARAVGIHLVLATQRPSVDVITGVIKANLPSRIAFQVLSKTDSRVVLDMNGAEDLLGRGDLLFLPPHLSQPLRLQSAFVSHKEVEQVVGFIRKQSPPVYDEELADKISGKVKEENGEDKELLREALTVLRERKRISYELLKGLHFSGPRATNALSLLEMKGLIGPSQGSKPREIFWEKVEKYYKETEKR